VCIPDSHLQLDLRPCRSPQDREVGILLGALLWVLAVEVSGPGAGIIVRSGSVGALRETGRRIECQLVIVDR
jgi:hypothetical protein